MISTPPSSFIRRSIETTPPRLVSPRYTRSPDNEWQDHNRGVNIDRFSKKYEFFLTQFEKIGDFFTRLLIYYEYIVLNQDNIQDLVCTYVPRYRENIVTILDFMDSKFKWANTLPSLLLHLSEYLLIQKHYVPQFDAACQAQIASAPLHHVFSDSPSPGQNIYHPSQNIEVAIANHRKEIKDNLERCRDVITAKFIKLFERVAAIGLSASGVARKTADKTSKYAFGIFRTVVGGTKLVQSINQQNLWVAKIERAKASFQSRISPNQLEDPRNEMVVVHLCDALLRKHAMERKFFVLRAVQYIASFCLSTLEFGLRFSGEHLLKNHIISKIATSELSEFGMPWLNLAYIFFPLYPKITLKTQQLVLLIPEWVLCRFYKPNQYSLKGCYLSLSVKVLQVCEFKQYGYLFLEVILKPLSKRCSEDDVGFYARMKNDHKKSLENLQQRIKILENDLEKLEVEDAKVVFRGPINHPGSSIEDISRNVEKMRRREVDDEIKEFFREHIGYDLSQENTVDFQAHLESLFCLSEHSFVNSYDPT